MKVYLGFINIVLLTLFLSACTSKVTIKRITPSQIENSKITNIYLQDIENDKISQEIAIKQELLKASINNKKLFNLSNINSNIDAIIKADITQSSLDYKIYYKKEVTNNCLVFLKKTNECIEREIKYIPCEKRTYKVTTNIEVLQPDLKTTLFAKSYSKSKYENRCFEEFYDHFSMYRKKQETNTKLAKKIAYEFVKDISPKYEYKKLEIIEEINSIKTDKKIIKSFEQGVELLDDDKTIGANEIFKNLNQKLKNRSWEVLYNLALSFEALNKTNKALYFYKKAKEITKEKNKDLVIKAIKRVKTTQKLRHKALFQLP
ncbi:MAG: hypothetical protein ACQERD_05275 [Campylobacterota bacterium]